MFLSAMRIALALGMNQYCVPEDESYNKQNNTIIIECEWYDNLDSELPYSEFTVDRGVWLSVQPIADFVNRRIDSK